MRESFLSQATQMELERILKLLCAPAPRVVDNVIARATWSPVAALVMYMGLGWSLVFLVACIVLLVLHIVVPAMHNITSIIPVLILGPMLLASLSMFVHGLRSRRRTTRVLLEGTLCKGRVLTVSPLPSRINGRSFFRVRVEVQPSGGEVVTATDTVDNWAVEYFLDARDQQKEVDVLYSADVPRAAILPIKIAATRRFD